jgi:hypothetical protein
LISREQEYRQKAECCEDLAVRAKGATVKIALQEAARQWRARASLLAQNAENDTKEKANRAKSYSRAVLP